MAAMGMQRELSSLQQRHSQQQQQMPPAHLPASPTLTNPDMILPDYERPISPGVSLDDARAMWKHLQAVGSGGGDLGRYPSFGNAPDQFPDDLYGPTGPVTPTTPIIYGNGTMLSDIGEVTEAESTPGKMSPESVRSVARAVRHQESATKNSDSDGALRSSPTMPFEGVQAHASKIIQRERRDSIDSTSTIRTLEKQQEQDHFVDFDDSVSVEDSVFQGDDEESMAESYTEPEPVVPRMARLGVPQSDNLDRLSITSSSSISRRAEEILANAKMKLSSMESTLTRARNTIHITSPTRSSYTSESTPSPPGKRASTAILVREPDPDSPTSSPGRSRFARNNPPGPLPKIGLYRSASALGASGGYRQPVMPAISTEPIVEILESEQRHGSDEVSPHSTMRRELGPMSEDSAILNQQLGPLTPQSAKLDQFLSPTFGSFSGGGVQRSASVTQVRDLKDQVQDLKGKISSLREQARKDSLKRRSLQSLRTPSPFTHAQVDQWYAESKSPSRLSNEAESPLSGGLARAPWSARSSVIKANDRVLEDVVKEESFEDEESVYTDVENQTPLRPPTSHSTKRPVAEVPPEVLAEEVDRILVAEEPEEPKEPEEPSPLEEEYDDAISDMHTENGDVDGQDEDSGLLDESAYGSESGESLYHDTVQHPISHEDREDAFDYEHFFLHSAMGTMSQQRLARKGSRSSYTSESSVETTRGPIVESSSDETDISSRNPLPRSISVASVSTVGTFATAYDGSGGSTPDERPDTRASTKRRSGSPDNGRLSSASNSIRSRDHSIRPKSVTRHSIASFKSIPEEDGKEIEDDPFANFNSLPAMPRRPMSSQATPSLHRATESTGTTRSFPLVVNRDRKANSVGILTPQSLSPDQALEDETTRTTREQSGNASANDPRHDGHGGVLNLANGMIIKTETPLAVQSLLREDQYLVERLVANLGKCVLGLTENGKASAESRMYRRRIDAARRILEGLDS